MTCMVVKIAQSIPTVCLLGTKAGPSSFGMTNHSEKARGHAGACPLHNSDQLRVDYAPAPLEKLPTASASVLYTSKTVRSLVICRTSWNLLPKWQSLSAAPCVLAL